MILFAQADKNDSPNIICEQRNLMQAQCRLELQIELEVSEYAKMRCERYLDCVKSPTTRGFISLETYTCKC